MRRALIAAFLLVASLPVPSGAQTNPVIYEEAWDIDAGNWTAGPQQDSTQWRRMSLTSFGGSAGDFGWYAGRVQGGVPLGYDTGVSVTLTSSPIDITDHRLIELWYRVQGQSREADVLSVQMREVGAVSDWVTIHTVRGADPDRREFQQLRIVTPEMEAFNGKMILVRFLFTSSAQPFGPEPPTGFAIDDIQLRGPVLPPTDDEVEEDPDTIPESQILSLDICRTQAQREAEGNTHPVDLVEDQGKTLRFRVFYDNCEGQFPGIYLVGVRMNHTGRERLNIILEHVPHSNEFIGYLKVNNPELVVGNWDMRVYAWAVSNTPGQALVYDLTFRDVPVTATGTHPDINVWAFGREGDSTLDKQRLGPGGQIRLVVDENRAWPQLQKVTYQLEVFRGTPARTLKSPELPLTAPYVLTSGILDEEGPQQVVVRAYDRARPAFSPTGDNVSTLSIPLDVDLTAPVIKMWAKGPFQVDRPFPFYVNITEPFSPTYKLRLLVGSETVADLEGEAPGQNHTFNLVRNRTGSMVMTAIATDGVNLTARETYTVTVRPATTNTTIGELALDGMSRKNLLIGGQMRLITNATQEAGFAKVPVEIVLRAPDGRYNTTMELGAGATREWRPTLPLTVPGVHTLRARVDPLEGVEEATPDNQEATLDVEIFLGRVDLGDKSFLIRAGPQGHAAFAVDADNNDTYSLSLRDLRADPPCNGAVYTFTYRGELLCWNPLKRDPPPNQVGITTLSGPVNEIDDQAENNTPLPLVTLLAGLIFTAWRRRD